MKHMNAIPLSAETSFEIPPLAKALGKITQDIRALAKEYQ